jgi:hypothetical protein
LHVEILRDPDNPLRRIPELDDPPRRESPQASPDAGEIALCLLPEPDELQKEISGRGGHLGDDMEKNKLHSRAGEGGKVRQDAFGFGGSVKSDKDPIRVRLWSPPREGSPADPVSRV